MRVVLMVALFSMLAVSVFAEEPTIGELEWHKQAIEARIQRDTAQNQTLQLDFNNLAGELVTVTNQLEKAKAAKADAEAKAKAEAEKAKPPEQSK